MALFSSVCTDKPLPRPLIVPPIEYLGRSRQLTVTLVTLALPMVPVPLPTVQF